MAVYLIVYETTRPSQNLRDYVEKYPDSTRVTETSIAIKCDKTSRQLSVELSQVFGDESSYYVFTIPVSPPGTTSSPVAKWFDDRLPR